MSKVSLQIKSVFEYARFPCYDTLLSSLGWMMLQHCFSPSGLVLMALHSDFKLLNVASLKKVKNPQEPLGFMAKVMIPLVERLLPFEYK